MAWAYWQRLFRAMKHKKAIGFSLANLVTSLRFRYVSPVVAIVLLLLLLLLLRANHVRLLLAQPSQHAQHCA